MRDVVMVVPRRADNGRRDQLWKFCRKWWMDRFPHMEIIEGHHDDGPFNRSKAINSAVKNAGDWRILLIADADVVAEPEQVTAAIANAQSTGRATLAYTQYMALREDMTTQVMAGYNGSWSPGVQTRLVAGRQHVSSIMALPYGLWRNVDGYDERFVGWGSEDMAFYHSCRVRGGGVDQIPGTVWHLWHRESPERDARRNVNRRAGRALSHRYGCIHSPKELIKFIDERREPDGVLLMVITDGRRDCITRTIPTLANLKGLPITRRIICDDSGDADYVAYLRVHFSEFEVIGTGRRSGYAAAMSRAWETALQSGQKWVWWHEDDFLVNEPIDLSAMAQVMESNPHLANMVLLRQPWFPKEIQAGGIIAQNPSKYTPQSLNGYSWLEHRLGYWLNPHLVARSTLAKFTWPRGRSTENIMGRAVAQAGMRFAYWGTEPLVEHIGTERQGTGY